MSPSKERSGCPISCSLDIWGDKWSLLIVRDLMFTKQCTYSDFLKSPEKIATNILASRLEMLEKNQIIEKTVYPENKRNVYYKLTRKGIDMLPILVEVHLWAAKYLPIPEEKKAMLTEMQRDKEGFIQRAYEGFEA